MESIASGVTRMQCGMRMVRETGCGVYAWASTLSKTIQRFCLPRIPSCLLICKPIDRGGRRNGASCGLWQARTSRLTWLLIRGVNSGLWPSGIWWSSTRMQPSPMRSWWVTASFTLLKAKSRWMGHNAQYAGTSVPIHTSCSNIMLVLSLRST